MFVISSYNLMRNTHSGNDEAVLTVSMCGLVQVHEIHVDLIIRKFLICLCM